MHATTTWDDVLFPGEASDFFARRPFPPFNPTAAVFNSSNALWLAELAKLGCPVFYTEHSLGAALATLAAARRAPKAGYAFGSPRVGNQAFTSTLASVPIRRQLLFVTDAPESQRDRRNTGDNVVLIDDPVCVKQGSVA